MVSIDTLEDLERAESLLTDRGRSPARETRRADPAPATEPRTFVVDVDGVVAALVPDNDYARSQPLRRNIARLNALHARGHRIVLFTARGSASGIDWSELTRRQLRQWGVRFDELRFGKPAGDYYIDDRHVSLDEALALAGVAPESEPARGPHREPEGDGDA